MKSLHKLILILTLLSRSKDSISKANDLMHQLNNFCTNTIVKEE